MILCEALSHCSSLVVRLCRIYQACFMLEKGKRISCQDPRPLFASMIGSPVPHPPVLALLLKMRMAGWLVDV